VLYYLLESVLQGWPTQRNDPADDGVLHEDNRIARQGNLNLITALLVGNGLEKRKTKYLTGLYIAVKAVKRDEAGTCK